MNEPAQETVRYHEPGSGAAPLLWGPAFAVAGYLFELSTPGPVHGVGWVVIGVLLLLASTVWVYARRRFMCVRLTDTSLRQGSESLDVARIAEIREGVPPANARALGGSFTVPRKYGQVPLRLDDGSLVVAWARDAERLRTALHEVTEA